MRGWMVLLLVFLTACEQSGSELESTPNETSTKVKVNPADAPIGALSDAAYPMAYRLDMQIDPRKDSFSGRVSIDIQLNQAAAGIWMHGQFLQVNSVMLQTADGATSEADYQQVLPSGVSWVGFGREVAEEKINLVFDYQADFDQNLAGLFKVEELGDAYALAKSESIQARKYLPGFDQPGFKAPFTVSLTIPKGYQAIGNAPEISRSAIDASYERVQFDTTPPMSTYLLSLAVGPFDVVERPAIAASEFRQQPVPLRGFARRGRGSELNYVLDITPRYIEIFEQALGRPYPFKKLDIVAAPAWPSGATELSGAITYREERLFLDDNASAAARLSLLGIHAHEIAHMWFGNQVTPPWWDDLWLKEGFATWATPMVLSLFEPQGQHDLNGLVRNFAVMGADSLANARAIREPILRNEDIRNAYDGITYSKSQAVIHMLDSYFGADKFRRALGGYLQTYADSKANSEQFYQSIGEQTQVPQLTQVFQDFVEQQGVPVFDIKIDCTEQNAPRAVLQQSRYQPLGSLIEAGNVWNIPACVRYPQADGNHVECAIVTPDQQSIALQTQQCPSWIMPNANGSGYYRWQLSADVWQSLLENFDHLSAAEQLSLVDSVLAGFEAGTVATAVLLQTIELSAQANTRHVVEAPLAAINRYIRNVFTSSQADSLRQKITPLYVAALERVNQLATAQSLSEDQALLKNKLLDFLAVSLQHQVARQQLLQQATSFTGFNQPVNAQALDSDLYAAALSVAVQDIGADFYQHLLTGVSEIDDPRFAGAVPVALGAFNDADLLPQARRYALTEAGPRESFDMISSMLRNPTLRAQHWQWYQDNLSAILETIPSQWQRRTPRVAGDYCSTDKITELQTLFEQYGDQAPGHELALRQTAEAIALCVALRQHLAELPLIES